MSEDAMKNRGRSNSALPIKQLVRFAVAAMLGCTAVACQEPSYRTEVVPNLQGGVEVHRVNKDAPPPVRVVSNTPTPAHSDDQPITAADRAKRIAHLEALIQDMNAEIERLKREQAAEAPRQ
ncbi:MAG TPA: FlxA-like family protein [Tepidisphaeraceae bacterium]|jgi:hypothetical protein|nr:FlxA-like family protein [Tepidisphaeraceae bacterium]